MKLPVVLLLAILAGNVLSNCSPISVTATLPDPPPDGPQSYAGTYQQIDSNWISGSCYYTQLSLTLDTAGSAKQLAIANGVVAVPISEHLAKSEPFNGPATISSASRNRDSITIVFTMNQYDRPYILNANVAGDTLRGSLKTQQNTWVPLLAVRKS